MHKDDEETMVVPKQAKPAQTFTPYIQTPEEEAYQGCQSRCCHKEEVEQKMNLDFLNLSKQQKKIQKFETQSKQSPKKLLPRG